MLFDNSVLTVDVKIYLDVPNIICSQQERIKEGAEVTCSGHYPGVQIYLLDTWEYDENHESPYSKSGPRTRTFPE
jgi:hypothetical protein